MRHLPEQELHCPPLVPVDGRPHLEQLLTLGYPQILPVADGGNPFYDWSVSAGRLPDGLILDRFDGVVFGTPTRTGTYEFTVQVEEYGGDVASETYTLTVG